MEWRRVTEEWREGHHYEMSEGVEEAATTQAIGGHGGRRIMFPPQQTMVKTEAPKVTSD